MGGMAESCGPKSRLGAPKTDWSLWLVEALLLGPLGVGAARVRHFFEMGQKPTLGTSLNLRPA